MVRSDLQIRRIWASKCVVFPHYLPPGEILSPEFKPSRYSLSPWSVGLLAPFVDVAGIVRVAWRVDTRKCPLYIGADI